MGVGWDYSKLLKDVRWLRKRDAILRRDEHKCTVCGSNHGLQVHHTFYYDPPTKPWLYPDDSLLTLCESCHHKWHCEHENEIRPKKKRGGKRKGHIRPPRVRKRISMSIAKLQEGQSRFRRKINGEWIVITIQKEALLGNNPPKT